MTDRLIDISEASLISVRNQCLIVQSESDEPISIPIADIGSVIIHAPRARVSTGALSALAEKGIAPVICDSNPRRENPLRDRRSNYSCYEKGISPFCVWAYANFHFT